MKIETSVRCYLSEKGHNNFWYPSTEKIIIPAGCEYEKLNWISGSPKRLTAIKIKKSCVLPVRATPPSVDNMSPPQDNSYIVVWMER